MKTQYLHILLPFITMPILADGGLHNIEEIILLAIINLICIKILIISSIIRFRKKRKTTPSYILIISGVILIICSALEASMEGIDKGWRIFNMICIALASVLIFMDVRLASKERESSQN